MNKIIIILSFILILPANGQKLNETYLQAKADMFRERYAEAGQKILSIPVEKRTSQMYHTLGESFYRTANYVVAANFFTTSDSLKTNTEAMLNAARSFAMMQQPAKAAEWLQKYLSQRDKLSEAELNLDPAFAKIEHSREWKTLWNKEWYNTAERKTAEAAVLLKRKRYTEALGIIDTEIANSSSSVRFYALRAKVYEAMEQYDPAHESAQTAIRLRNNNPEYFTDAARLAIQVKKYDVALDNINMAIRFDPYQLELYLQRAAILRLTNRYNEARNDLNFYFTYFPADPKALYQMGLNETEAGNPLAGIDYFTMLIDNDQTSPEYYIARANAGIKANNYSLAGYDLAQTLDLKPSISEAWHKKGIVLHQENKLEDACYYWKTALDMGNREAAEYIYIYCKK